MVRTKPRRELLLAFALVVALGGHAARADDFYAQEKCSICHIRESVFFDARFAAPDTLREFGEERMCMSCHNGSVRDSRSVLWRGAQHPAPGGRGSRTCSPCHSPHSKGGWSVLAGTSVPLSAGGDALCGGCHKGFSSRGGPTHRKDFAAGGCRECHRAHGGTGASLLREGKRALCLRCHRSMDSEKTGGHPLSTTETGQAAARQLPECVACHAVHGDAQARGAAVSHCLGCHKERAAAAAKGGREHPGAENCLTCHSFHSKSAEGGRGFRGRDMRVDILCGKCHEAKQAESETKGREKGTHVTIVSARREDLCFRCHRIHGGAPGTPLLASAKEYACLGCHVDQNTIRETGDVVLAHPVFERVQKGRLADAVRSKRIVVGTSGEIVCRTCHTVHGAVKGSPLLAPGFEGDESCFWCHEAKKGMSHVPAAGPQRTVTCDVCHPVHGKKRTGEDPWRSLCGGCHPRDAFHRIGGEDRTLDRPKDLPVFDRKGRRVGIGAISCPTCHQSHGPANVGKKLHRRYDSSAALCTACHRDGEAVALTPHDLRGIAGKSLCEPCHLPHGGTSPRMWGVPGGSGQGEEACRSCHREKGMATALAQGGHPRNVVVTRTLPSYFPLAGDSKAGAALITCATCHDVHGTGILPFGEGARKLLRLAAEAGANPDRPPDPCLACHPKQQVAHGKAPCTQCHPPHREVRPVDACVECHKIGDGGAAPRHAATGKGCGACHKVHVGERDAASASCVSCHRDREKMLGTPHAELDGGPCAPCHPAHADLDNVIIKRKAWENEILAADRACLRCHRPEGSGPAPRWIEHPNSRKKVGTTYGATVEIESVITMVSRFKEAGKPLFPMFDEAGRKSATGRLGCVTCHEPHAAISRGKSGAKAAGGYLRDPSGAFLSEVCSACHRENAEEHVRKFHVLPRKIE